MKKFTMVRIDDVLRASRGDDSQTDGSDQSGFERITFRLIRIPQYFALTAPSRQADVIQ